MRHKQIGIRVDEIEFNKIKELQNVLSKTDNIRMNITNVFIKALNELYDKYISVN